MSAPPLHRVRIRLEAPLGTPLTSGTLFGHLCWAVREAQGEAALGRWLAAQDEAPWILSDGFPEGLLPRPLLPPSSPSAAVGGGTTQVESAKKDKRRGWVGVGDFLAARGALSPVRLAAIVRVAPWEHDENRGQGAAPAKPVAGNMAAERLAAVRLAHNTIDRRRGTTPEEGGLYFVDEDWTHAVCPRRDIYVRTAAPQGEIRQYCAAIGEAGYGRDATWGRGRFAVEAVEAVPELDAHAGTRLLSLSHGTITDNMADVRYRLMTHYGKLGQAMAAAERPCRPFKRPIVLTRPGATFRPAGPGPFGALLACVHQDRPEEVRHDARHVAIPYTEVEST